MDQQPRTGIISYHELRVLVIAAFDRGSLLKSQSLTFSHGNTGNDYQALARKLDNLVADLESRHVLILRTTEDIDKELTGRLNRVIALEKKLELLDAEILRLGDYIAEADNFRAAVKAILGSLHLPDEIAISLVENKFKASKKTSRKRK